MVATITDTLDGTINANVANTVIRASKTLLNMVQMQYKYGAPQKSGMPQLTLVNEPE